MGVRDLQIDIPNENAIVEYVITCIQKIGQYRKIPPPQSLKKQTLRTVEIVAVADVHVDAPVVEDTEIYDEPPKENPKTVKKGAKSSAKGLTKKKTQPHLMLKPRRTWENGTGRMRFFINGGSGK